jgi:hypothetical protein
MYGVLPELEAGTEEEEMRRKEKEMFVDST